MRKGLSNIVTFAVLTIVLLNLIILYTHNINDILTLRELVLLDLEKKFRILNEKVNLVFNGSLYLLSDKGCPIRYVVIYDNGKINIALVNKSYMYIDDQFLSPDTLLYVVTCSGNIIQLDLASIVQQNNSFPSNLLSIRTYLFQPGKKEIIDPSTCPILFHKYNNSYGFIEVNTTFNLFCYNGSGLVYDPPVMYFYNVFLADISHNYPVVSLFTKGYFNLRYNTRNAVLRFMARFYDVMTNANVFNETLPNLLNLKAQKAVQWVSLINNTTSYLYAWPEYSSIGINGTFLVYLNYSLDNTRLSVDTVKIHEGFIITDQAFIVAPSTLKSINYYVMNYFYNNSSFTVKKLPINLNIKYSKINETVYSIIINTSNGTLLYKELNTTNIVLFMRRKIYEDKYVSIILDKIWLYEVLNKPTVSLLLKITSKRETLSVLAYETRKYLMVYNSIYSLESNIKPIVVQQYYDGKILGKNEETKLFVQAYYTSSYVGTVASDFIMKLPYIVIITDE